MYLRERLEESNISGPQRGEEPGEDLGKGQCGGRQLERVS